MSFRPRFRRVVLNYKISFQLAGQTRRFHTHTAGDLSENSTICHKCHNLYKYISCKMFIYMWMYDIFLGQGKDVFFIETL